VRTAEELRTQLHALEAKGGGGDEPGFLFDALYEVANMGCMPKGGAFDPMKWRSHSSPTRLVIAFTVAQARKTMVGSGCEGGTVTDLINVIHANRICFTLFAPEFDSYLELNKADFAEYFPTEPEDEDLNSGQQALIAASPDMEFWRGSLESIRIQMEKEEDMWHPGMDEEF
jgi:hypothetical protein